MSAVAPANQTVQFIRNKVRLLTGSPSEQQLSTALIDQYINNFYTSDFPNAIKTDQLKTVYSFYTAPYIDRYYVDVNYMQGFRGPVYIDGFQGQIYKDRQQFYNIWPRYPSLFRPITGDGITTSYNFNIPGPFLRNNVTLGGVDNTGAPIYIQDNGEGVLNYLVPNSATVVPAQTAFNPFPGQLNRNTGNPNVYAEQPIGTVDYVSGNIAINLPLPLGAGEQMTAFVSQYQPGRPYSMLFYNDYIEIRPIPRLIHKCEIEVFMTPVQFMLSSDEPILDQYAQYLAYGSACEILRDRQDTDGLGNIMEGFKRQEALVLERQSTEEVNSRNTTIFAGAIPPQAGNYGWNQGFWY